MKRSSFWLKAAAAAASLAVLGVGAALVALKAYFPEPVLRERVLTAARRQLGREMRLERIGLGLTGLSLKGLEISERPDFKAGTFVSVETFHLRPSWRALARRRLVVAAVSAAGLKVRVVKAADGRFNYETLASSAPAAAAPQKASEGPAPELSVRRARITRGLIEYRDGKDSWTLSDLSISLDDFSLAESFDLDASFHVRGQAAERPVDASVVLVGSVDPAKGDRKGFKTAIKRLVVEQDGLKLSASGRVADLSLPDLAFDAVLSASGKTLLQAEGKVKLDAGTAEADVKAKTPGLDTTLLAKFLPKAGIPALQIPAAEASVAGRYAPGQADVRFLSLAWSGGRMTASGSARGLGTSKPVFDGKASWGVDVPEIPPGRYPFLKLPPKAWVPATRLEGEASLSGEDLRVQSLKAKLKQGTLSVSGVVRRLGSAKPVLDLAALIALDLPAFKISDLPVAISGVPASFSLPAARLEGTVRVSGDDVRLEKVSLKAKEGSVRVDGTLAKALAGTPQPEISVEADMNLPALTDKDLPFPGVPAGLQTPPSRWEAQVDYSPKAVRVRKLRLETGKNIVAVEGSISDPGGRAAFDLLVKCKSFVLDELTRLTPRTRDMKLAGSGYFALSVTGHKLKPVYAGKLQFKDIAATVAGLPLSEFTGAVSFDERRVDLPNLKGKVADGSLLLDLTVKAYSRAPEIQLEASLDRFDLGKYLAAKNKAASERQAAKAAKPGATPEEKTSPLRTRGRFEIGALTHPNASVEKVKLTWDLTDITPDLKSLNGEAKLGVGPGKIHAIGEMATQSKLVKILVFPLLIVQKLGRVGGIRLFPDFNDIVLRQITGDYAFKNGVMTLRQSEMDSDAARVSAKGSIDLPQEGLDLIITAQVANVAPIDVAVTGAFSDPKSKVNLGKFLADPAKQLIQGLLRK
ncbi:MAG TPA: hypothetical protein DCZ01_06610 [Elusimicrobia bacterium]|nr:MAG: hypothetical protein A2X37_11945 [Elusimicrobia bacterium GWA2_66_18]OGR70677.1 MAG: hypothetical protein A2X40_06095 [Elusimicrobia bacterium GWC2_65_9]HAZ08181.1 hypothetical protein [Elusimicrobiota bacterium]